jgi:hypothetical protein
MTKMKIVVTTPKQQILTYIVDDWEINNGVVFFDDRSGTKKGFPVNWCEFTEVVK